MAHGETLAAISAGAVFMGANTYIGNAPNFMVRSIAVEQGVKMPSFFGYMAWSVGILVPVFLLITFLLSAAGVYIGGAFGDRFQGKAELAGGVILVLMGSKILLEHLGFLG